MTLAHLHTFASRTCPAAHQEPIVFALFEHTVRDRPLDVSCREAMNYFALSEQSTNEVFSAILDALYVRG